MGKFEVLLFRAFRADAVEQYGITYNFIVLNFVVYVGVVNGVVKYIFYLFTLHANYVMVRREVGVISRGIIKLVYN